jgi:hypothetical protein
MLLPVVAGLGALLLANPLRGGKRRAKAHARQLRRMTVAARANKRTKGAFKSFCWSLKSQCRAGSYGIKRHRSSAAVQRGIRQAKQNPYIVDPFTGRKVSRKSIRVRAGGPVKRRRGGIAGVRGADGVWRRNPQRKPTLYRLASGDVVTAAQLRRMFMGKIPGPVHRRLLGIRKV